MGKRKRKRRKRSRCVSITGFARSLFFSLAFSRALAVSVRRGVSGGPSISPLGEHAAFGPRPLLYDLA